MPDPVPESRLAALRRRWEEDRSSPVFLPLAEEYRRVGRLKEALEVLETGLQAQPRYLSALVALGRCRLEMGNLPGAVESLERAVEQDPAQLVANKLLVETYLRQGEAARARARLDLYSVLNDRDPEIEALRQRIANLAPAPAPAAASAGDEPRPPEPAPVGRAAGQIFRLDPPAGPPPALDRLRRAAPVAPPPVAPVPAPAAAAPVTAAPGVAAASAGDGDGDGDGAQGAGGEPFPGLGALWARRRYEEALERILAFPRPRPAFAAAPVSEPIAPAAPLAPVADAPQGGLPDEVAAEATVTLGRLYLRQGYDHEAEEIFRAVLRREPGDAGALAGLEAVRARRQPPAPPSPQGLTARKVAVLTRYLGDLRRGAPRDVS